MNIACLALNIRNPRAHVPLSLAVTCQLRVSGKRDGPTIPAFNRTPRVRGGNLARRCGAPVNFASLGHMTNRNRNNLVCLDHLPGVAVISTRVEYLAHSLWLERVVTE